MEIEVERQERLHLEYLPQCCKIRKASEHGPAKGASAVILPQALGNKGSGVLRILQQPLMCFKMLPSNQLVDLHLLGYGQAFKLYAHTLNG